MTYLRDHLVKYIVVHYSATAIEADVSIDDIDKMHKMRGFKKAGYHIYIRKNGFIEKGRDLDQPGLFEMGAHSQGENDQSIGICYEGGVYAHDPNRGFDSRTKEQIDAMITTIDMLLERFPNAKVVGHRDMPGASTQCPGFDATAWWDGVVAERESKKKKVPFVTNKEVSSDYDRPKKKNIFEIILDWIMNLRIGAR